MADVKERPILFSAPMVRALLDDRKTQTRRAVKPQPEQRENASLPGHRGTFTGNGWNLEVESARKLFAEYHCPYGKPGDRLWVRETFFSWRCKTYTQEGVTFEPQQCVYRADGGALLNGNKWKPSIFMPRWASRITLEVTQVRVERLQDISGEDAEAEGVFNHIAEHSVAKVFRDAREFMAIQYYRELWESINGVGSWDANPWVWALTFRKLDAAAGKVAVA